MPERDVIVRCPGCGNGKVVSLALGQLLQCDICRTAFRAPVASDTDADPSALDNAIVDGLSAESEQRPSDDGGTTQQQAGADRIGQLAGNRGHDGRTDSHSADVLEASPARGAQSTSKIQPALPSKQLRDSDEELDIRHEPGTFWTVVAMLAVGVILTLIVVTVFFIVRDFPSSQRNRSMAAGTQDDSQSDVVVHWTDASRSAQRRDSMTLKIERVVYGSLRAKDLSHQVITTADDNLLGITISARNQGRRARAFQNWYRHVFEADNGQEIIAELLDDQKRDYSLLTFDDVSSIEGQRLADEIGPQQSVQDTVVFLIPKEVNRSAIKYFRLALPGAAVGMSDFFRFEIPTSMIEGFDDQPAKELVGDDEPQ